MKYHRYVFACTLMLALALPTMAADPCPAFSFPLPPADRDARIWSTWDGASIVKRHASWPDATGGRVAQSAGWALLREIADPYPAVDHTLLAVGEPKEAPPVIGAAIQGEAGGQVHQDLGCVRSTWPIAYRPEDEIVAAVGTLSARAQAACALTIEAGSLSHREDYNYLCAVAAGVAERRRKAEQITDPGESDAGSWCAVWTRDCAGPNTANAARLLAAVLGARAWSIAHDGQIGAMPDLSIGWTHTPTLDEAPD